MGINVTANSTSNQLTSIAKQTVPNTPVVVPAYSSSGWTAGDFLYQSSTGVNAAPTGSASIGGPITTLQATNVTVSNGGLFTANQTLTSLFATGAVYTGPSTSADNVFFTNTPSATANTTSNYCATLLNGNLVVAYYDSGAATPGYYYAIYNSSGGTVLAPTFIANNNGSAKTMVGVVAKANGNFRIMYWTTVFGNVIISNEYTAAGTFVNTTNRAANEPRSSSTCVRTIELTNGNVVMMYWNTSIEPYMVAFNAANTGSLAGTSFGASTGTENQAFALYTFPTTSTSISNGFGCTWWSANNGQTYYRSYTAGISAVTGTTGAPNTMYDSIDIIRVQDGTFIGGYGNSGSTFTVTAFSLNTSTGALSTTGGSTSLTYSQYREARFIPMAGSGFAVTYINGSQQLVYRRTSGLTPTIGSLGSEIFVASVSNPSRFASACGTNAFLYFSYWDTSAVIQFSGAATATLVNGTTYTAAALSPPNYTFFGIAQTTVSAGQTGNVIVSGLATANNSMPSIAGTQYFDTTQTPIFGNKGFVTGRNFTLKGFE